MTLKKSIEITDEEINAIYSSGRREATTSFIKFLVEKINKLEDEIHHIKLQLLKDSHNSSKPPSTDPPDKKKSKSLFKPEMKGNYSKDHNDFLLLKAMLNQIGDGNGLL